MLERILDRLYDLERVIENHLCHPDFQAAFPSRRCCRCWSARSLVVYDGLAIGSGEVAVARFARMALGEITGDDVETIRRQPPGILQARYLRDGAAARRFGGACDRADCRALAPAAKCFQNETMNVTLKNVPEPVYNGMKREAKRNRRSLNAEMIREEPSKRGWRRLSGGAD